MKIQSAVLPLCIFSLLAQGMVHAQATWRLQPAQVVIGDSDSPLHRVNGAVVMENGLIGVADDGNSRVAVFDQAGTLVRNIGRAGSGPSDFQSVTQIAAFGDTLVVYDGMLARVSLFTSEGKLLRTVSLVAPDGRIKDLRAVLSALRYVVSSRVLQGLDDPSVLYSDTLDLWILDATTGSEVPLGKVEWRRTFHHVITNASTGFNTPFIGETVLATSGDRVVMVPLGQIYAEVIRPDGQRVGRVDLPLAVRMVDRATVNRFRDSSLERARRRSRMYPNAVAQISDAFGERFPVPQRGSVVRTARAAGRFVWLEAFPRGTSATRVWYAIDPAQMRIIGQLELPVGREILGGRGDRLAILTKDELGVEYVRLHDLSR